MKSREREREEEASVSGKTNLTTGGSVSPFVLSPQVSSGDSGDEKAEGGNGGREGGVRFREEGRRRRWVWSGPMRNPPMSVSRE